MIEEVEDRIRERAHGIWESEGRPAGRSLDHWFMAARELERAPQAAARPRAARKSAPVEAPPAAAPKRRTTKAKPAV